MSNPLEPGWLNIDVKTLRSRLTTHSVEFRGSLFIQDAIQDARTQIRDFVFDLIPSHLGRIEFDGSTDEFVDYIVAVRTRAISVGIDVEFSIGDHSSYPVFVCLERETHQEFLPVLVSRSIVNDDTDGWAIVGTSIIHKSSGLFICPDGRAPALVPLPEVLAKIDQFSLINPAGALRLRNWIESVV